MTDTITTSPTCEWFALCIRPSEGFVTHPVLGDVLTCGPCAEKLNLDLVRCITCKTCAMHGIMVCRETCDTCDVCKKYGDVFMDYCHSGDREKPDQTICLDCLCTGRHHITHAHEEKP